MVEKDAGGGNTTAVLTAFASKLEAAIDTGAFASQKASWVKCANINTAVRGPSCHYVCCSSSLLLLLSCCCFFTINKYYGILRATTFAASQ